MYPMAMALYKRKTQAKQEGKAVMTKTYDQLYFQIWLLLPSFFSNPSDTATAFPAFAKVTPGSAATQQQRHSRRRACVHFCMCVREGVGWGSVHLWLLQ